MKLKCLGSSSAGNCYLLQFSAENYNQVIMVEAGYNWKEILRLVGINNAFDMLWNTKACLITHGHSDHAKGIKQLTFNDIPVYASEEVHKQYETTLRGKILKAGETKCIAPDIFVYPFKVEHDYPNSLGFIIKCSRTNETILFVNDCKYYEADLSKFKFDYIFMECNYIDKQTRTIYHEALKAGDQVVVKQYERVINSHMSLATTTKNIAKLNLTNTKAIFLMHLSDRNANEYKMKLAIEKETIRKCGIKKQVFVCQRNGGVK